MRQAAVGTIPRPFRSLTREGEKPMSIKEMISEHPSVGADYNEQLAEAVKQALADMI